MQGKTRTLPALFAAAVILPSFFAQGCSENAEQPTVTIGGTTWDVELATTDKQRYKGLSGREYLAPGTGMLFVYPSPRVLDFCMRGCVIGLDIAFIDANLRVLTTYTMSVEADRAGIASYSSLSPAQFALELPAGSLKQAGIRPGDRAVFSTQIHKAAKGADEP